MNATELEARIVAAIADPTKVRALVRDFKAHKDAQLDRLTQRLNQADARVAAAQADADGKVAEYKAKLDAVLAKIEANPEAAQALADEIAAARRTKAEERIAAIEAEEARLAAEKATLRGA